MRSIEEMKKAETDSFKDALADAIDAASGEEYTFRSALQTMLDRNSNICVTENGAVGYAHTPSKLLDINFRVSSLRNCRQSQIALMYQDAYYENRMLAVKWMFFAGDVRGGLGERRLFCTCLRYLAFSHPDIARAILPLAAEYTRWDNLFCLMDSPLERDVITLVKKQLKADRQHMKEGKTVSLLAKWMPSVNASSAETRRLAHILAERLYMTDGQYRKMLSGLRSYMKVVEVAMSSGRWDSIDYTAVPSRANLIYSSAFMRNDHERRTEYLTQLAQGDAEIHADVLFPHEIVHKYNNNGRGDRFYKCLRPYDVVLESLWQVLPDYVEGNGNTICVADGSGSMMTCIGKTGVSCLDVANALAIYFAERCSGPFKETYITFSARPKLVDLSPARSLREKIEIAFRYCEVANTNIEAVFDLILQTAVENHMVQADIPQNILILSDMEFDACVVDNSYVDDYRFSYRSSKLSTGLFDNIAQRYKQAGYRLPRLIFWNLCSRTGTVPVIENELGVALVSGFSPTIMKMVLDNSLENVEMAERARISPVECLLNRLNSERYDAVELALKAI